MLRFFSLLRLSFFSRPHTLTLFVYPFHILLSIYRRLIGRIGGQTSSTTRARLSFQEMYIRKLDEFALFDSFNRGETSYNQKKTENRKSRFYESRERMHNAEKIFEIQILTARVYTFIYIYVLSYTFLYTNF